jgi:hypothetical protein
LGAVVPFATWWSAESVSSLVDEEATVPDSDR